MFGSDFGKCRTAQNDRDAFFISKPHFAGSLEATFGHVR